MSTRRSFDPINLGVPKSSSIPPELADHYAFRGYNSGCCGRLVGNLAIVSVFVSDPKSTWSSFEMANYKQEVTSAANYLLANGGRAAGLHITEKVFLQATIPNEENKDDYVRTATDAIHDLGYSSFEEFRSAVARKYNKISTVAVFFVLNKDERSFALSLKGRKSICSTRRSDTDIGEYSVIYAKAYGKTAYTICHELLHLYGAIDLYYPEKTKRVAKQYCPHSIMLCAYEMPVIDNLTRFLVGWDGCLNHMALSLLKGI